MASIESGLPEVADEADDEGLEEYFDPNVDWACTLCRFTNAGKNYLCHGCKGERKQLNEWMYAKSPSLPDEELRKMFSVTRK